MHSGSLDAAGRAPAAAGRAQRLASLGTPPARAAGLREDAASEEAWVRPEPVQAHRFFVFQS